MIKYEDFFLLKTCPQMGIFWHILETFVIMSLIEEYLYYWIYRHSILPCIVRSNIAYYGKHLDLNNTLIFRKVCLMLQSIARYEGISTFVVHS